jgi:HEPN domain-containing protein
LDKNTVKGWTTKADHDLEVTLHADVLPSDVVCYHAQQAAEKYLKAFLIANDIEIKKFQIHDIDRLLVQCDSIDPEFEKFSDIGIGKLTDYAVKIRKYEPDYFENKRL